MAQLIYSEAISAFIVCLFSTALAHAQAALTEVQYQVTYDEQAQVPPAQQRLMVIMLDGFRHDYLEHKDFDFPGFRKVINNGVKPKYLVPDFPTLSYPNYYSFMTGRHTERHGMTGNYMYDAKRRKSFKTGGGSPEQYHSHWWNGAEPLWVTAEKQNRSCYMYHWPGCEVNIQGMKPTHCSPYNGIPTMDDFRDAITKSLTNLQFDGADVIGIYFELTDYLGHNYGPANIRLMQVIADLDPIMGYLADSLVTIALDDVNLMIVSDHGMTSVSRSRVINLNEVLQSSDCEAIMTEVAVASIYTKRGKETEVYKKLKNFHPNMTVYRRDEIPDRWRYKRGRYVAPIIGVADMGWFILGPDRREFPVRRNDGLPKVGWHGYSADSGNNDMMGIFIGMGPGFRSKVTSPPIHIVDIYQVMCYFLQIDPAPNSGSWSRVANIVTFDVTSAMQHDGSGSVRLAASRCFLLACFLLAFVLGSQFCVLRDCWL